MLTGSVRLVFMDHLGEQCKALRIQQSTAWLCSFSNILDNIALVLFSFTQTAHYSKWKKKRYESFCKRIVNQLHVINNINSHNGQTEFHYCIATKITIFTGT